MSKDEFKKLTPKQKFLYIMYIIFSYGGSTGILLYSFLIEKLFEENVSIMTKLGCSGILCIIFLVVFAIIILNKHINKKIESYNDKQKKLLVELAVETDLTKKEDIRLQIVEAQNYETKIKCKRTIFKHALICGLVLILVILFNMAQEKMLEMRGICFGVFTCLMTGFGFNTAYEIITEKLNLKK